MAHNPRLCINKIMKSECSPNKNDLTENINNNSHNAYDYI